MFAPLVCSASLFYAGCESNHAPICFATQDVIVYATGFDIVASLDSLGVVGPRGVAMRDDSAKRGGPEAYLGLAAPGFPNLFFLAGPNTGLGHSSMISMIEAQARYVAEAIARARVEQWATIEVKADACTTYNATLQSELLKNVWASCVSWYNMQGKKNVSPSMTHAHARGIDALPQRIFRQGSFSAARCRLCSGRLPFLLSTWRRVTSSGLTTQSHGSVQVVKFRHGW